MGFRRGSYAKELGGVICGKIKEQTLDVIPTSLTFAAFSLNIYEYPVKQR